MKKSVVALILVVVSGFATACGPAAAGLVGYTCENAGQGAGQCSSFQICCKAGGCYYLADGTKFSCNASDCSQAATQAAEFCLGTDVLSGYDLAGYDIQVP